MKILACGDLHLGAGSDYGREPGERLREQENVWSRIVDVAVDHGVDAVLFAGDAFERRRPTPSELLAFKRPLDRLRSADIQVVLIVGNHDVEAFDRPAAVDLFVDDMALVVPISKPTVLDVQGDLPVACLPWTPVGRLVATRNGGERDEVNGLAADLLLDTARGLRAQVPDGQPAILLLHWSISGAALPTGIPTDQLREPVIPLSELERLGFDAIVAGHIHKPQLLATDPREPDMPIFYVGSPMPLNFGEASVEHGVWILESHAIGTHGAVGWAPQFVPIDSRPFVTINWASQDFAQLPPIVEESVDGAIVKVRYRATAEQARRIDHAEIRQALVDAGAHKVYAIEATIEREARARVEGLDESVGPMDAVDAWLAANPEPVDGQANAIRVRTAGYLEEAAA